MSLFPSKGQQKGACVASRAIPYQGNKAGNTLWKASFQLCCMR